MTQNSFEFVILGPPFSVNIAKKQPRKHREWQEAVGRAAREQWIKDGRSKDLLPLHDAMEVVITTFFTALRRDVDNVVKPILDGLKNVIYADDGEIFRLVSQRVDLTASTLSDPASALIAEALTQTQELVHVLLIWGEIEEEK